VGEGEEFAPLSLLKQKAPIAPRASVCYRGEAGETRAASVAAPAPPATHTKERRYEN